MGRREREKEGEGEREQVDERSTVAAPPSKTHGKNKNKDGIQCTVGGAIYPSATLRTSNCRTEKKLMRNPPLRRRPDSDRHGNASRVVNNT